MKQLSPNAKKGLSEEESKNYSRYMRRSYFVHDFGEVLKEAYPDIKSVEYIQGAEGTAKPWNGVTERVRITYDGGYVKLVNVECDSLAAIIHDVERAIYD